MCRMDEVSSPRPDRAGLRGALASFARGQRGRRRRLAILGAVAVLVFAVLAALRQTAPPQPGGEQAPTVVQPRFTPSPSASPRGDLPKPAVVDPKGNRIIGHIALVGASPGESTALLEVEKILDWYCPESTSHDTTFRKVKGWDELEATARPRPGSVIVLSLRWTGTSYRWEGAYDALEKCW
jgi:hypothetical protein